MFKYWTYLKQRYRQEERKDWTVYDGGLNKICNLVMYAMYIEHVYITYLNLLKLSEVEEEGGEEESHAGPALTHASQLTYRVHV